MQNKRFIIHIADLHIGNGNRSSEYRQVFDNFSEQISSLSSLDPLIVICGDIFHHKIRYSGTDVEDFNYLLNKLSKYSVIIIPGNHDANLNNHSDTDLLTPLLDKYENIHYLKQSGFYKLHNLTFYHVSIFDNSTSTQLESLICNEKFSDIILLYHGMINGATFGSHIVHNSRITKKIIDSVKLTLAGDIHQYQLITPTCAYCGSLIQQNLGESNEKGFILWDLLDNSSKFIRVINNKGFIRLDFRGKTESECDEAILNAKLNAPSELIKVSVITDTNDNNLESQLDKVKEKFGTIDKVSRTGTIDMNISDDIITSINEILQVRGATDEQRHDIIDIYKKQMVSYECKKWYITKLSFSNMFKYGPNNVIDFSRLYSSITGVIADNRAGKSSIIDIIVFGLFGELLRGDKKSMIHTGAKKSSIRVDFVVNTTSYYIERTDDRLGHQCVKLYRYDANTWVNITTKSIDETYKLMKTLIGSLDQFQSTGLYYDSINDIIKMTKSERMQILPELFGMTDNISVVKDIKSNIKSIKSKMNTLVKPRLLDPHGDLANASIEYKSLQQERHEVNIKYTKIIDEIELLKISLSCLRDYKLVSLQYDTSLQLRDQLQSKLEKIIVSEHVQFATPITISDREKVRLEKLSLTTTRSSADIKEEILRHRINVPNVNIEELKRQKLTIDEKIAQMNIKLSSIPITTYVDIEQLIANRESIESELRSITTKPTHDEYIEKLKINMDKLRKNSSLTFNISCEQCNTNRYHINHDLATLEDELSSMTSANTMIHADNRKNISIHNILSEELNHINEKIKSSVVSNKNKNIADDIRSQILKLEHELISVDHLINENIKYQDSIIHLSTLDNLLATALSIEDAKDKLHKLYLYDQYSIRLDNEKILSELQLVDSKLESLHNEMSLLKSHESSFDKIKELQIQKSSLHSELSELDRSIGSLETNISQLNSEIIIFDKYNTEYPKLKSDLDKFKLYVDCLESAELKLSIIKKNIDRVVSNANDILSSITDFNIKCSINDLSIELFIIEPNNIEIPMSLGSGFQKFISSIAMRLALTSSLPSSSDFIMIDEGFGCMDGTNISKLVDMMSTIKELYKFTFIISHISELQNIVERPLHIIQRENKDTKLICSYINNSVDIANVSTASAEVDEHIIQDIIKKVEDNVEKTDTILCECGATVKRKSLAMHKKTAKHMKVVNK